MKPKNLKVINNIAYLNNYNLYDLAKDYQTPLMVFDEKELDDNINLFKNKFKSNKYQTHIVYASKAFLTPIFAKYISKHDLYIDAVSLGDLFICHEAGFDMHKVVFHGNNKTIEELNYAIDNDVLIVVDHLEELIRICNIANALNKNVRTLFRVNPGIDAHTHKYIQTATFVSKFGESIYDTKKIDEIMKIYQANKKVRLLGFHSHIGSQIQEAAPFMLNIEKMISFTKEISTKYSYPLVHLNLGGGFGIPYTEHDLSLDKEITLTQMIKEIEQLCIKYALELTDLYIEPGRSLLGNSCVSLYTIGDLKQTYGNKNYLFIDGGMTDNIRPALYQASYQADVVNRMNDEKTIVCDIAGKCCESGDIIINNALMPKTFYGDILMVYATGAYTYSMSSNYNSALKIEVLLLGNEIITVAKRQSLKDLL